MRNTKKPIQLYRGTTQQHSDYAGPVGEITVDTEKYTVVVQNGVTGGVPLAREDTVVSLTNRIAVEESARATADTALQKSITDEASARETADTAIQKSVTDEVSARETADNAFQKQIAAHTSELSDIKTSMAALGADSVHKTGDETITGAKTFTEKLLLAPKEDDQWLQTYIYGAENTLSLNIQNRNVDAVTDPYGYPARSSLILEANDNTGQGRFSLLAQSKYDTTNQKYHQYSLLGTSDGSLTWTGGNHSSRGDIEIVDSSSLSSRNGYIRYSSGLQICWGYTSLNGSVTATNKRITFPKSFTVTPAILTTFNANIGNTPIGIGWESTTAFSIGAMNNSQTKGNTSWIAVGPWK